MGIAKVSKASRFPSPQTEQNENIRMSRSNRDGSYVFSVAICGPKGQNDLAQGLPWVKFPNQVGPEEAVRYGEDWLPIGTLRMPIPAAPPALAL